MHTVLVPWTTEDVTSFTFIAGGHSAVSQLNFLNCRKQQLIRESAHKVRFIHRLKVRFTMSSSTDAPSPAAEAPADSNLLQKVGAAAHTAVQKTGEALHKAVDATILDKSPHGTMIDGTPRLDGAVVHDIADATVFDKSPHGVMVDGTPRLDGAFLPGHHDKK
jgi:hypothetical protein